MQYATSTWPLRNECFALSNAFVIRHPSLFITKTHVIDLLPEPWILCHELCTCSQFISHVFVTCYTHACGASADTRAHVKAAALQWKQHLALTRSYIHTRYISASNIPYSVALKTPLTGAMRHLQKPRRRTDTSECERSCPRGDMGYSTAEVLIILPDRRPVLLRHY